MVEKDKKLSPSAKAFLALMAKVKERTLLEIMRDFNEGINQKKTGNDAKDKCTRGQQCKNLHDPI